jgi:hypothetical protein
MTGDHGARLDPASLTDHRTCLDDDTRPHLDIGGKGSGWVDEGCGMEGGHFGNDEG